MSWLITTKMQIESIGIVPSELLVFFSPSSCSYEAKFLYIDDQCDIILKVRKLASYT